MIIQIKEGCNLSSLTKLICFIYVQLTLLCCVQLLSDTVTTVLYIQQHLQQAPGSVLTLLSSSRVQEESVD